MKYRPEIDGLRAVAVLPVLFFHAGFSWVSGGFVGVDVFFVISGYLITRIIADDVKAGTFTVWGFYERRFRRISPALAVVCIATIPFAWLWMVPREFDNYSQSLFAVNLFVSNFLFWKETDYFSAAAELKPLLHTWSLGVEEQFYLFFPLLLWALRRRTNTFTIVAGLVAASFALTLVFARFGPAANFYLLPTRFWELGLGSLLALAGPSGQIRGKGTAELASMAGLAMILGAIFLLDGSRPFPGWWALPPVLGTGLIIAAAGAETLAGRILSWRPLVAIGLVSYSVYLWHQPLFAFARIRLFGEVSTTIFLLLIGLTLVLAYATWRWVEQPFRDRNRLGRTQVFTVVGTVGAALIVFGLIGDKTSGLPIRHPDQQFAANLRERMRINTGLSGECEGRLPLPASCRTSDAPDIIVWGDSFAMHLVAGIMESNPATRMAQFTKSACGPFIDIAPITLPDYPKQWAEGCQAFNDSVKAYITQTKSLRFAVLSSPFAAYVNDGSTILYQGQVIPSDIQLIRARLKATLEWLIGQGVTPVLFAPPPRDGSDVGACLIRSRWFGESGERCAPSVAGVQKFDAPVRALLGGLEQQYRMVDVADFLCDKASCKVEDGDIFIYRDGGHFSYEGSRYLGRKMSFYETISQSNRPVAVR